MARMSESNERKNEAGKRAKRLLLAAAAAAANSAADPTSVGGDGSVYPRSSR